MTVTMGLILKNRASFTPDLEAIVTPDKRFTYREFNQRVNQLAHYLLAQNVRKGDRVALLCATDHYFPTVFYAAAKIGAIAVPLNSRLNASEVEWIVKDSQPKVLFYDGEFSSLVSGLEKLDFLNVMIQTSFGEDAHPQYGEIFRQNPVSEPNVEVLGEDPIVILYTSGTTGKPKGVLSSHQSLFISGVSTFPAMTFREKDRMVTAMPLFHVSGVVSIASAAILGFTLVLMPKFHPVHIWDFAEQESVTQLMAVPMMMKLMLPSLWEDNRDVGTLRTILTGGSDVPVELIRQYDSLGFTIINMYGASEFTGVASFWSSEMGLDKMNSIGKALASEIRIIDRDTGKELLPGEIGEVVCRGFHVFQGYWNNEEETKKVLRDGWYYTGDAGKFDEEGFLYIVDRYKDVILVDAGENVYPAEVERVIRKLDGVREVAVVGVKDDLWGELPWAYVALDKDAVLTEQMILAHVHKELAAYKLAQVHFLEELPKNSLGKVKKFELKEQANQEKKEQEKATQG
ncbi:class I adenylate-forming enzyme family protein [Kroppenstedtia sanguinis]|uniref:Class I adenylate-forming enzyme family protein n=1 Tax=Kroppenstedtia sanguinis TaxID=1380684 RepID=A0ABW4CCQ9_9BACL